MKLTPFNRKGPWALFALIAAGALAFAPAAVFAAAAPPEVSTSGALFQGLLGLLMVLAALAAFFWFLRRFSPGQSAAQGVVKVIGGVMLGPRERLVVVEVGDTWLLLGIGGGQVNTLHTLPRPEGYTPGVQDALPALIPGFADKLKELLSKRQG
ncbi:MAG: flagellar biosynthetic protein FliO [Hydrogenophilales bacterium 28-61-23]|nr:MAG: flagellar biosynthetic protein FliO [Hydrogenophilales bacterium 28-61-23]